MAERLACGVLMLLELDVGNSACKWRLQSGGKIHDRGRFDCLSVSHSWRLPTSRVTKIRGSSVASEKIQGKLERELFKKYSVIVEWASSQRVVAGVTNAYGQPEKLGVDRWLAIVSAYQNYGASVVIDAGSALTVDLVDADGLHLGGYIAPGLGLMSASLLRDTANVRFECSSVFSHSSLGQDTAACVGAAIKAAQVGVVQAALNCANSQITDSYTIVITGGDAEVMAKALDERIIIHPDLVLDGLQWLLP